VKPEEAVEAARAEVERRRAAGDYAESADAPLAVEATERVDLERLLAWALIEPDPDLVYSTRRLGAPITWVKRGLLRALRQYLGQIVAQQTRFNVQVVAYLTQLEERVAALEERKRR
jgi:hypothetical protein